MLTNLTLHQFALADHLDIDIPQGFTILTGETGAGKSLLLDAMAVCLGERADSSVVRFGQDKADVTASFDISHLPQAQAWLQERELDQDHFVQLRRVILANGRSKAWINSRPCTLADLKELATYLVQLHSQHSQQQLLNTHFARQWLDQVAGLEASAAQVRQLYQAWQGCMKQQKQAEAQMLERESRLQLLGNTLEDLEPFAEQDYSSLEQEHDRLSNFEQVMQDTQQLINGLDGDEHGVLSELQRLLRLAQNQATRSPVLSLSQDYTQQAYELLQDAARELRQFADQEHFDAARLAELDHLMGEYHRLGRKYRCTADQLQQVYRDAHAQLTALQHSSDVATLTAQAAQAYATYEHAARQLSDARHAAAPTLADQLTEQTRPLSLPHAQFAFALNPQLPPNADGLDDVQLLFSANQGMPLQPLSKIASGGELSRVALIMQVINASSHTTPVLVFDEVDVGISGGTAELVGRLLRKLGEQQQILCVTHQAQVAAQGHQHLLVEKQHQAQTASQIRLLSEDERIFELARLSGGVDINQSTLAHAQHLRQQAELNDLSS